MWITMALVRLLQANEDRDSAMKLLDRVTKPGSMEVQWPFGDAVSSKLQGLEEGRIRGYLVP